MTPEALQTAFTEAGIVGLPTGAYHQFSSYLRLLLYWNSHLNLTAIREPGQIIGRHFVECAFAAQHLPAGIATLLDYGSGAGLPGIAIAICRPEIRVTLAESQGKKASFLREAVRTVGLSSEVFDGRVQEMAPQRVFGAVSMRAVEKMELALPVATLRAERYLALLTTVQLAAGYKLLTPELEWLEPVPLPHAESIILAIGQRV